MCFSAGASFASGAVITAVGGATLTKVAYKRELPLALLPLLFGIHQIEEGVVWLSLEDQISPEIGTWAKWLYVIFAHGLLPTISPLSIFLIERYRFRRWMLAAALAVGLAMTVYTFWTFLWYPVTDSIVHHSVEYQDRVTGSTVFSVLYICVTCGPMFLSGDRSIVWFGALNIFGLTAAAVFKHLAFTSVWCAWAAMISVLIFLHFRARRRGSPAEPN
jgi:hypothetical protein